MKSGVENRVIMIVSSHSVMYHHFLAFLLSGVFRVLYCLDIQVKKQLKQSSLSQVLLKMVSWGTVGLGICHTEGKLGKG